MVKESVSVMIYRAASSPPMDRVLEGRCRLCGTVGWGVRWEDWVRVTFTDFDCLFVGEIVCEACQFCSSDRNVVLQSLAGKDKPQRMRNYSHIVTMEGNWVPLLRSQRKEIADLLINGTKAAVISLTGQKHLIFRAVPGMWQVEEVSVWPRSKDLEVIYSKLREIPLVSKSTLLTGRWSQWEISRLGKERWLELEELASRWRGNPIWRLAVWLCDWDTDVGEGGSDEET